VARAAGGQLGRLLTLNVPPAPFEPQQQYLNTPYYENGPRVIPNTNLTVSVNASWILVPGEKQ